MRGISRLLEGRYGTDGARQVEEGPRPNERPQACRYVHQVSKPGVRDVVALPHVPGRTSERPPVIRE